MNFDDIVDAMHDLRSDGYEAEKLIVGHEEYADLLSDANMMQASSPKSSSSNQQVGTVAGADVEVNDVATPLLEGKASNHTRAVPVLESGGFVHENVNGHHLVESVEAVSCINCDEELTGLTSPEMKRWAHGHFLSNKCPEK